MNSEHRSLQAETPSRRDSTASRGVFILLSMMVSCVAVDWSRSQCFSTVHRRFADPWNDQSFAHVRHFECATPIPLLTVSFGAKIASADVDSGLDRARLRLQDPRTIVCKSRCVPQCSRVTGNIVYVRLQALHCSCALGGTTP